jgi:diguanylate cyclase (GGDEF)-like protein
MNRRPVHDGAAWNPADAGNWVPREAFLEGMADRVSEAVQRGRHAVTFCLDLDQFRAVNYTLGWEAGDQVIGTVAERLSRCIGEQGVGTHMGGDEFALCLWDCGEAEEAAWLERVLAAVEAPIRVAGREVRMTASIGIASTMECGPDAQRLLQHAAAALLEAKEGGRNTFRLYMPGSRSFVDHSLLVYDFERALAEREFFLEFQPRVHAETGVITSAEALLRWRHPQRGRVMPGAFIPIAERTGWIVPIGRWVVEEVCRQIREWLDNGQPVVRIAVNVSARQFQRENFVAHITEALEAHQVDPRLLEIELTETAVVEDVESARKKLGRLRDMGITVSIDDFGVGYSSLSFLHQIPVDALKLDRSFIQESGVGGWSVMETIIDLGHRLNLCVVGEGVETECQLALLRDRRCDEVQGFFFSRPVPAADFVRLLAASSIQL